MARKGGRDHRTANFERTDQDSQPVSILLSADYSVGTSFLLDSAYSAGAVGGAAGGKFF